MSNIFAVDFVDIMVIFWGIKMIKMFRSMVIVEF